LIAGIVSAHFETKVAILAGQHIDTNILQNALRQLEKSNEHYRCLERKFGGNPTYRHAQLLLLFLYRVLWMECN
jgi:hypothetical protein